MTAQHEFYRGTGIARVPAPDLPEAPAWCKYTGTGTTELPADDGGAADRQLGRGHDQPRVPATGEVAVVNAAIQLRRPLVVTGPTGVGKASLAYLIARELALGPVLRWTITARTTLTDGLCRAGRLGPLGTALLPYERPRVLLITALDRAPLDLPEEIMAALHAGEYFVDGDRLRSHDNVVLTVTDGLVRCREFPIVVITSNGEREFSPGFLRQCLRLRMAPAGQEQLTALVAAQVGDTAEVDADKLVAEFLTRENLAADQLLNAAHLARSMPLNVAIAVWQEAE